MENNITFNNEVQKNIENMSKDRDFLGISRIWNRVADQYKYSYNFTWLGRPIIQLPQDMYAHQELIWKVKPDLIIETGIAHGGSLILHASMLALLDYCEHINPENSNRKVLGIDIEIRQHNKESLKTHPLNHLFELYEKSSVDKTMIKYATKLSKCYRNIMVFLDSNHSHKHVLDELKAYAPLVSLNSYCVVCDTGIEDLPDYIINNIDRPWRRGNNPKSAVQEYLNTTDSFEIDKTIENKLVITASPCGFLRRIKLPTNSI